MFQLSDGAVLVHRWAKGWWRRGVVATLQRSFVDAVSNYKAAVEREPDSEVFAAALEKAEAMIGSNVQYVDANGDGGKPPSLSHKRLAGVETQETAQSALTPEATLRRVCADPMSRPGATAKPEKRYMQGATQGDIRDMLQTGPP